LVETVLTFAAAINAALLAAALGARSLRKRAKAGVLAALYLAVAAGAVMLIAADHADLGFSKIASSIIEGGLTFVSGPLFLLFAAASFGSRIDARALAAVLAALALAAVTASQYVSFSLVADRLVFAQMAFTAAAAWIAFRAKDAKGKAALSRNFVFAAIAGLGVLHAAQLVRTFWPQLELFRDVVPFVGAIALLALCASVYLGGRLGLLDVLTDPPPVATPAMRALAARVEALLADGLLKTADLTTAEAAAAAGISVEALAGAMRAVTGAGFAARLQQLRVEEAQRLLADPAEARTSMEAIGLLAGFGSRSAFYQAFSERVGMSPAAYRKSLPAKPVRNGETGQD
jgi:AraC-like DNA-binding protein